MPNKSSGIAKGRREGGVTTEILMFMVVKIIAFLGCFFSMLNLEMGMDILSSPPKMATEIAKCMSVVK